MWDLIIKINKKLILAIPTMMLAGFLFGVSLSGDMVSQFKTLILPLTFLMVYPMMVTLNVKHLLLRQAATSIQVIM